MPANGKWDLIRRLKVKQNCAPSWTYLRDYTGMRGQQNTKLKWLSVPSFRVRTSFPSPPPKDLQRYHFTQGIMFDIKFLLDLDNYFGEELFRATNVSYWI